MSEYKIFIDLIMMFGAIPIAIYFYKKLENKQTKIEDRLDKQITELKDENKEDKKMFQSAINGFNESVREFKNVNKEMTFVQSELKDIKNDLTLIKENQSKMK